MFYRSGWFPPYLLPHAEQPPVSAPCRTYRLLWQIHRWGCQWPQVDPLHVLQSPKDRTTGATSPRGWSTFAPQSASWPSCWWTKPQWYTRDRCLPCNVWSLAQLLSGRGPAPPGYLWPCNQAACLHRQGSSGTQLLVMEHMSSAAAERRLWKESGSSLGELRPGDVNRVRTVAETKSANGKSRHVEDFKICQDSPRIEPL